MAGSSGWPAFDAAGVPVRRWREHLVYGNAHIEVYDDETLLSDGSEGRYVRIVPSSGQPA